MKSVLIIGLGRFGRHLCEKLMSLGDEVMVVDRDEEAVSAMASVATSAQIADCTDEKVLRELGVSNFDLCCVCIGSDFTSSLLITALLKDMGAKRIVSKAARDIHARLLQRNGADEVVYPERDSAERVAMHLSASSLFDYIELTDEYAIYEFMSPDEWVGHSVRQLDVRNRYHANILAIKQGEGVRPMPGADYVFEQGDHVLALVSSEDAKKLLRKI